MGATWGFVVVGMLAVLLVVFVVRLRRSGSGSGRGIAVGVVAGLLLVGLALVTQQTA